MAPLYPRIVACDAMIIGFPVYSARECAQLATFMDRWDCMRRFEPAKRGMVIGTWGLPVMDAYDHVVEYIMLKINVHGVETVEAISACGLGGMLRGLDENRKAIILRYPKELEKSYQAGKSLVTG